MNETIKTLGYLSWKDPYAWMEDMSSARWREHLQKQKKKVEHVLEPLESTVQQLKHELSQRDPSEERVLYGIGFDRTGATSYQWYFVGDDDDKRMECGDLDMREGGKVWIVRDTSTGDERYKLEHYEDKKKVWSISKPMAPYVAVQGGFVYGLESENHLWHCRLVRYSAQTGKHREVVFEMTDPEWNLTLIKGEHQCLFLLANNAGKQRLWYISGNTMKELTGMYESFVPVGFPTRSTTNDPCFFARLPGESSYVACGKALQKLHLPSLAHYTPESLSFTDKKYVGRRYGKRFVWNVESRRMEKIFTGEVPLDSLLAYHGQSNTLTVMVPGQATYTYGAETKPCPYASVRSWFAKSRDGTQVPIVCVSSCKPTNLFVIGYAAYGLPTHMGTERWKPLLRRGFALIFVLARGSGDHTDAWAEAGRREQKVKSVEDYEAGIRSAQTRLHISAQQTFLYGRSAGGYLVGATLARNPSGNLFRGIYTEVPYVDVLTTTSNPSLPLTKLEYNEFGNPLEKPQDAQALLALSPIHALPPTGAPSIFVLCRTALHDKEVYAYESVKWITKLQDLGASAPKLLTVTEDAGHFGKSGRAEDLALFLFLAQSNKKTKAEVYKMANTRRNRKNTRKNTRKNRKNNMTMRKNRNNAMMGGKRKNRKSTTRRNRK